MERGLDAVSVSYRPAPSVSLVLCTDCLYDAVCKNTGMLTALRVSFVVRPPEEDLNLDSEPAAEDTVGEATVSALLFGDEGGWRGKRKMEISGYFSEIRACTYMYPHAYPYGLCTFYSQ